MQNAINAVGKLLVLFGVDVKLTKIQDKPLPWPVRSPDVFYEMQIFISGVRTFVFLDYLFDIHGNNDIKSVEFCQQKTILWVTTFRIWERKP